MNAFVAILVFYMAKLFFSLFIIHEENKSHIALHEQILLYKRFFQKISNTLKICDTFSPIAEISEVYFVNLKLLKNKGSVYFVKSIKRFNHNDPPPKTAPANKGQKLQVPSRPSSRGYTVLRIINF